MSLSNSEHQLLADACGNMNAAAETCRQVLDMLRSLGASGVVDIAEHNNAASVHANAQNLVHIDGGEAHLGDKKQGSYTFRIAPSALQDSYQITRSSFLDGADFSGTVVAFSDFSKFAFTDSNDDLYAFTDKQSSIANGECIIKADTAQALFSDADIRCSVMYRLGDSTGTVGNKTSSIVMRLSNASGTAASMIDFEFSRIIPHVTNTLDLGSSTRVFNSLYLTNAPIVSSDGRRKADVAVLNDSAVDFILGLRPVSYRLKSNGGEILAADDLGNPTDVRDTPGVRQHWGFIAQEVKDALAQAGIEDAAVWCLADKDDPGSMQSIRYEEIVAPLVKAVQALAARVSALEAR